MATTLARLGKEHQDTIAAMAEIVDRVWRSGYLARQAGLGKSKCPLASGSEAAKAWLAGWRAAGKDC